MVEIEKMLNYWKMGGSNEPKLGIRSYHTSPALSLFLGNMHFNINMDKQFPNCINKANPSGPRHQTFHSKPPENSCDNNQKMPQIFNNSNPNNNNKKKKKKKRRRKKKNNQTKQMKEVQDEKQVDTNSVIANSPRSDNDHWCGCSRQRQLSTESDDSFIIFFDDQCQERISELSENETETEDFDSSDSVIPNKKVRFAEQMCVIHPMVMWSYAYQAARKGPWEEYARNRDRFNYRIKNIESKISHVFKADHRARIYEERFA